MVSLNPWLNESVIDRKSDWDYHGVGNYAVLNLRIRVQSISLRDSSSGPSKDSVYVRVVEPKPVFWAVGMEEDIHEIKGIGEIRDPSGLEKLMGMLGVF